MDENIIKTPDTEYLRKQEELARLLMDTIENDVLGIKSILGLNPSNIDLQKTIIELWLDAYDRNLRGFRTAISSS